MDHSSWPKHVHPKSQEIHPEDVPLGGSSHLVSGLVHPSDLHGISRVNPLITGVITHLLSGMSHQALFFPFSNPPRVASGVPKPVPSAHQHSSTEPQHLGRSRERGRFWPPFQKRCQLDRSSSRIIHDVYFLLSFRVECSNISFTNSLLTAFKSPL